MIRVFISYSQDSEQHKQNVLQLANKLRDNGIETEIDQYEQSPLEGWPKWMDRKLREADYVLVVCTKKYLKKINNEVPKDEGKGIKWESTLTYQALYDAGSENKKFIPIIFSKDDKNHIPDPLKGYTRYLLNQDYESLYRYLTDQPAISRPPIGNIVNMSVTNAKKKLILKKLI